MIRDLYLSFDTDFCVTHIMFPYSFFLFSYSEIWYLIVKLVFLTVTLFVVAHREIIGWYRVNLSEPAKNECHLIIQCSLPSFCFLVPESVNLICLMGLFELEDNDKSERKSKRKSN